MDFCDLNFGCPIDVVCRCAGATGSQGYISSNLSCVSTPRLARQHRLARSPAQHCKPSDQHSPLHTASLSRCAARVRGRRACSSRSAWSRLCAQCPPSCPALSHSRCARCATQALATCLAQHSWCGALLPVQLRSSMCQCWPVESRSHFHLLLLFTKICALRSLPCRATTTDRTLRTRWCQRPLAGARPPSRSTAARASSATPSEAAWRGHGPGTAGLG